MLSFLEYEILKKQTDIGSESSTFSSESSNETDDDCKNSEEEDMISDPTADIHGIPNKIEIMQYLISLLRERLLKFANASPFNVRASLVNHFTR
jgi:hypothetical protein